MDKRPRCRKPVRPYETATVPALDPDPVCGRPEGHNGKCLSEDAYERERVRRDGPDARAVKRAKYAAARAAGATRAEATLAASRG